MVFFEEKNQENFVESFLLLFFKKAVLAFSPAAPGAHR
jgi:hypothetical protein